MRDCYPLRDGFSHYEDLRNLSHTARYLIETTTPKNLAEAENRLARVENHVNKLLGMR